MIGVCGEPQCLCKQVITPAPVALKAPAEDPRLMSDHELRWALRESITQMYKRLGLDEFTSQAAYHLGIEPLMEEE